MSFARDRLVENFIWTVGFAPEPQLGNFRREMTKLGEFISIIYDIYDTYGTLEDLALFMDVVDRLAFYYLLNILLLPPF